MRGGGGGGGRNINPSEKQHGAMHRPLRRQPPSPTPAAAWQNWRRGVRPRPRATEGGRGGEAAVAAENWRHPGVEVHARGAHAPAPLSSSLLTLTSGWALT